MLLSMLLYSHLLLQVSGHLNWRTPKHRSSEYVTKIVKELGHRAQANKAVKSVKKNQVDGKQYFTVLTSDDESEVFDSVIFACHPDQALAMLGDDATPAEAAALSQFHYSMNDTYVHCDSNLMPKSPAAWTSWNYIGQSNLKDDTRPVYVTYWLNKLQHLNHPTNIFVSLNPSNPPASDKIFKRIQYSHPQYTKDSVQAQRAVAQLQGLSGAYFCGAWMGYGFHEDGFRSGLEVAMMITGEPLPWVKKFGFQKMIPAPKSTLMESQDVSIFNSFTSAFAKPLRALLQWLCRSQIERFLRFGFSRGKLSFQLPNEKLISFVGKQTSAYINEAITVHVHKPWFWVRLALEADLGLARSYIAGEWEIENTGANSDGLTKFCLLMIDNMPNGKDRVAGGIDAGKLVTAWIGSALNMLWYRLTMDCSIANSRSNIHAVSLDDHL
jgi:cyclopropane-fatty-acyl-phospholipid synthase